MIVNFNQGEQGGCDYALDVLNGTLTKEQKEFFNEHIREMLTSDKIFLKIIHRNEWGVGFEHMVRYNIHDFHLFYSQLSVIKKFVLNNKNYPEFA